MIGKVLKSFPEQWTVRDRHGWVAPRCRWGQNSRAHEHFSWAQPRAPADISVVLRLAGHLFQKMHLEPQFQSWWLRFGRLRAGCVLVLHRGNVRLPPTVLLSHREH